MEFCEKCGTRLIQKDRYFSQCPKCSIKAIEPKKPTPPSAPIQVSVTKPAPPYKQLTPYLEQISKYRQEKTGRNLSPNNSQREIIAKIEDCIKNNKTRIVISAPTGCGKSWIAATLASAFGGVVLTSTNDLQDQYCGSEQGFDEEGKMGDFEFMNAVRGKGQYLCELSENTKKCDEAFCNDCEYLVQSEDITINKDGPLLERVTSDPEKTLCKYYKADVIGKKSDYSVYSYASYIARMKADQFKMMPEDMLPERTVLICDEAHDYDKVVSDLLSVELDGKLNQKIAGKSLPVFSSKDTDEEKIVKTKEFIEEILEEFEDYVKNAKNCAKHSMTLSSKKHLEMHEELKCEKHNFKCSKKCESCQSMQEFLDGKCLQCQKHFGIIDNCTRDHSNVLKDVNRYTLYIQSLKFILPGLTEFPNNYVITNQESNKFTIAPWRTSWFTKKILEKFNLCIFMSATINRTIISKETGISEDTFEFIDQASEIPEENRQIKFLNSYSYKDESDWNVVIEKIKEIFSKHSKQRGLILCTQYKQKQEILERFAAKFPDDYKRLTDDSQGRKLKDTILENEKKENGVIVSAKAGTGIDLKDDSSRFQIIIKAPYLSEIADRNNIRAQKIQQVDPQRYWIKSMFRLVQFAGRSVRGIDDYAETYVLDDSAKKMIINNKTHVPNWFLNACKLDAKLN